MVVSPLTMRNLRERLLALEVLGLSHCPETGPLETQAAAELNADCRESHWA